MQWRIQGGVASPLIFSPNSILTKYKAQRPWLLTNSLSQFKLNFMIWIWNIKLPMVNHHQQIQLVPWVLNSNFFPLVFLYMREASQKATSSLSFSFNFYFSPILFRLASPFCITPVLTLTTTHVLIKKILHENYDRQTDRQINKPTDRPTYTLTLSVHRCVRRSNQPLNIYIIYIFLFIFVNIMTKQSLMINLF